MWQKIWVTNPFQRDGLTGLSTKSDEELINLSEDTTINTNYETKNLIQFCLIARSSYSTLSVKALKVLLPFTTSCLCEVGLSAMTAIKNKYRNKLQVEKSLCLKVTNIIVDIDAVIRSSRKQAHCSHTSHYPTISTNSSFSTQKPSVIVFIGLLIRLGRQLILFE